MAPVIPSWVDVSRETLADLTTFHGLVSKWTKRINLVSSKSVDELWERHIWDSVQILDRIQLSKVEKWVDIGSGGGFPGIVCAIAIKDHLDRIEFTLVESDARKVQFLRACSREIGLNINVVNKRIEEAEIIDCDVVSARALANLTKLIDLSQPMLAPTGVLLAMKGSGAHSEILSAQQEWRFECSSFQSKTNEQASILEIKSITHVKN